MIGLDRDLTGFLVGAEGTLGIITKVRWKLVSQLPARVAALVPLAGGREAAQLLGALRAHAPSLESCDVFLDDGAHAPSLENCDFFLYDGCSSCSITGGVLTDPRRRAVLRTLVHEEVAAMRAIKRALDPANLLNPGAVLTAT